MVTLSTPASHARDKGGNFRTYPFKPEQLTSTEGISRACLMITHEFKELLELGSSDRNQLQCLRQLADRLPKLDPNNRYYFGEYYDPEMWFTCEKEKVDGDPNDRKARFYNQRCDRWALLRTPHPEAWPYPDLPKPKFPEPPNPPTYQAGMTSQQYFDALCKNEAGQFIDKTAEDVEAFYIVRPRNYESDAHMRDRYVLEDPWGMTLYGALGTNFGPEDDLGARYQIDYVFSEQGFPRPARKRPSYKRDESHYAIPPADATVQRHFVREVGKDSYPGRKEYDRKPLSQYGLYWRGIERPRDRDLGIAGGELMVIELATNQIMAVQRNFMRAGKQANGDWSFGQACRMPIEASGGFLRKVLAPKYKIPKKTSTD